MPKLRTTDRVGGSSVIGNPAYDTARRVIAELSSTAPQHQQTSVNDFVEAIAMACSAHVIEAQESERRRLALELHDELGQTLTALKLLLEVAQRSNKAVTLDEAHHLVDDLMSKVHDCTLDMRPPMLDDLGLLPTLLWFFGRYTSRTDIEVQFEHRGIESRFDSELETAAYRIVQEGLTNVARHANVGDVRVMAWSNDAALNLMVKDRGSGFDVEPALSDCPRQGLAGLRERVALRRGDLNVESGPGLGTCLTVQLPLCCG